MSATEEQGWLRAAGSGAGEVGSKVCEETHDVSNLRV